MSSTFGLDLVVLVPGKDDELALDGLLRKRCDSLRIKELNFKILRHPRRDPGCFGEAEAVLQPFQAQARHALVVFDHEGCGQEHRPSDEVAHDVRQRLERSGWGDRGEALVIVPELEVWVWSDSPHVDNALGWSGREPRLRSWLEQRDIWPPHTEKPPRPKDAVEAALCAVRLQRSSAIYRQLANTVSLERCQDPSFRRFVELLRTWFPRH